MRVSVAFGTVSDLAGGAAPEEKGAGNEVGGVKTGDGQRDNVLKCGGGANVNKREEARDDGDNGNCNHGD